MFRDNVSHRAWTRSGILASNDPARHSAKSFQAANKLAIYKQLLCASGHYDKGHCSASAAPGNFMKFYEFLASALPTN
jgi:hypothetical protein